MMKVKYYKCPSCNKKFKTLNAWGKHVDTIHPDTRPKDYSVSRYFYYTKTGKEYGICRTCKGKTPWNEQSMKYDQYCTNPECKKAYVKIAKGRMIGKYGKIHLLDDPEVQKKMLSKRKISQKYRFEDGVEFEYMGNYEKNFLIMLNTIGWHSNDLMSPSPHVYYYDYKNEKDDPKHWGRKFYIPDFYIPSLNLEIEIKQQTSTNQAFNEINRVKEALKDEVMKSNKHVNYIKINDNDFSVFFKFIMDMKEREPEEDKKENQMDVVANESYLEEEIVEESLTTMPKLFMISDKKLDSKVLSPRVPMNYFTKNGYEDNSTNRVCFAPSIDQCLMGLSVNVKGNKYYVYIPDGRYTTYTPSIKEVPDSKITGETWITEPVKVKYIGQIKVIGDTGEPGQSFTYGKNTAELYKWNWEWIEKEEIAEETCKDVITARKFVSEVDKLAKKYEANFFLVTDGASITRNGSYGKNPSGNPAVQNARDAQKEWERQNNFDPVEDWKKGTGDYYRVTYDGEGIYEALRKRVDMNTWKKLLGSVSINWLPKPPSYGINSRSFFTKYGFEIFEKTTLPVIKTILDPHKIKVENITKVGKQVYADQYQIVTESYRATPMKSTLEKNFKKKGNMNLKSFEKISIDKSNIIKLKKDHPDVKGLRHVDPNDTGYVFFDVNNDIVAIVAVDQTRKDSGDLKDYNWITIIEVEPKYRGYGLSKQLLDIAVKELKADFLTVTYDNQVAINLYKSYGFKIGKTSYDEIQSGKSESHMYTMFYNAPKGTQFIDDYAGIIESISILDSENHLPMKIKTPKDLSQWMRQNVSYKEFDKLMTSDEVFQSGKGSCHDQVIFEEEMFKAMKIPHGKIFFIEYNKGETQGGRTHTLLYYIQRGKYYWFENAWGGQEGIHGPYKSLNALKKDLYEKNKKDSKYTDLEFSSVGNVKPGMNLSEYVGACLNGNESFIEEDYTEEENSPESVLESSLINLTHQNCECYKSCDQFQTTGSCNNCCHGMESFDIVTEEANYSRKNKYPVFIVLMHTGTLLANIIKKFTHDEFSHACIAFNSKLEPLYSFGNKKAVKMDLGLTINSPKFEFFKTHESVYSVYVMYVDKKAYDAMQKALKKFTDDPDRWDYDLIHLISVWLGRPSENSKKYFCSRFCMEIISKGRELEKVPSLYRPQEMAELNDITLVNHGTDFYNYDYKITEKNLKHVKKHKFDAIAFEQSITNESFYSRNVVTTSESFEDVKNIVDTLDKEELLNICDGEFKDSPYVIFRKVIFSDGEPVSFIDVYQLPDMRKDEGVIVVACKKEYRRQKFTIVAINEAINWANNNVNIKKLYWKVKDPANNKASVHLAKKLKFQEVNNKTEKEYEISTESYEIAEEGLFSFFKKKEKEPEAGNWHHKLFGTKNLFGYGEIRNYFTGIKFEDGLIEIKGINYTTLKNRIKKYYKDKSIENIFLPKYNAMSYKKFEKKKIRRAQIKVDYMYTYEFFALELVRLFADLGQRYRDKTYKAFAEQIYKESWLMKADQKAESVDFLDTTNLKNLSLTLNDYQKEFIQKYPKLKAQLNLNGYILAFEQGLGKTLTAISLSECLNADHVYIVCPNSLKENWALEIQKYYKKYQEDDDLWKQDVFICSQSPTRFNEHTTRFIITNNESIEKMFPYVMSGKNMLILD